MIAKAGVDTLWPDLAARAILGDADGLLARLAGLDVRGESRPLLQCLRSGVCGAAGGGQ